MLVTFELCIPKCFGKEVNIITPIEKHFLLAVFPPGPLKNIWLIMFNILHNILLIFLLALKQQSQVGNLEYVPHFSLLSVISKLQEMKGIAT